MGLLPEGTLAYSRSCAEEASSSEAPQQSALPSTWATLSLPERRKLSRRYSSMCGKQAQ
ncbi:hypothetical protein JG688_00011894 [Phytophthora aleatoria]|uniref:Uncharacterized protein n=1 Tax=Phytophthora aleatoria TaxID=2496075 RepID=A0A8J5MEJ8_9STRA|nr:hypothetical protein JG688_00011894 [Phytophthora aleatoria]